MKYLNNFLRFMFVVILVSCSNDDDDSDTSPNIEQDQPENVITAVCDFDLLNVTKDATILIDCVLDLKGETITLPANVTLEFGGGDIIGDGTLVFSGGIIDGRLLSSKLSIEGDVKLKDPTFKFYAVRWDIVEGTTTSEIALKNNATLERLFFFTKKLGATTFLIDTFDAYFEVTKVTSTTTNANWYPSLEAVNLPSDFTLKMTENTHLRIFPADQHNRQGGAILATRDVSNVTVTGGTLHGDRDERVYSSDDNGLEGSHLFLIHSGKNITVDGVTFEEGSAGTFAIFSLGFSFNPDYNPTTGVVIKNCVLKNSRRMAIALTDGRDILIEGNTFIDAGQSSDNSDGGEVGYAINIEPDRYRDEDGLLKERQRVFDVLIKGNTEYGSRGGFVTLTIGQDITVEDNDIGTRAVYSLVSDVKITNNRFKALGNAVDSWAVFAAGTGVTVFNNEISNNTIEGYSLGIVAGSKEAYIHSNRIKNCSAGIQLSKAFNVRIHDNIIDVTGNGIQATNTYNDQIEIKGNEVTSGSFHVYFAQLNNLEENSGNILVLDNNVFSGNRQVVLSNATGITFRNNEINGGIEITNASDVSVSSNIVKPSESDGIRISKTNTSVSVLDNTVYEPTGADRYVCIHNDSDNPDDVNITGNTCN